MNIEDLKDKIIMDTYIELCEQEILEEEKFLEEQLEAQAEEELSNRL